MIAQINSVGGGIGRLALFSRGEGYWGSYRCGLNCSCVTGGIMNYTNHEIVCLYLSNIELLKFLMTLLI